MNSRASSWPRTSVLAAVVVAIIVLSLIMAAPANAGKPAPKNRIYFMVAVGFSADYDVAGECFKFKGGKMTSIIDKRITGTWKYTEKGKDESGIHVDMATMMEMEGLPIEITVDGYGRLDSRGKRSSFAGTARLYIPAVNATSNFAMAGREVKNKKQCLKMVEDLHKALGIE